LADLRDIAQKIRSKNAGPFWLTIDIFCGSPEAYNRVTKGLSTARVASTIGVNEADIKRFEIESLHVVKLSAPRPQIQGSIEDRDMHGASWGALLAEVSIQ